jgi:hypothetical protein
LNDTLLSLFSCNRVIIAQGQQVWVLMKNAIDCIVMVIHWREHWWQEGQQVWVLMKNAIDCIVMVIHWREHWWQDEHLL